MIELQYKNDAVYRSAHCVAWHPILLDVAEWIYNDWGVLVLTSAHRDSGIHGTDPLRAFDMRSYIYATPDIEMANCINKNWIYDPERPYLKVAVFHDVGSGMHGHIQVHDRTEKITVEEVKG